MLKTLVAISRPRFWLYLAGPALVGLAVSGRPLAALMQWQGLLFVLAWTLPANLFLYGVNDLADADTDAENPKKDGYERRLRPTDERLLTIGACAGMAALAGSALLTQSLGAIAWTAVFLILGVCYSLPPQRFKAQPFADSASNILYVAPGLAAAAAVGVPAPLVVIIAAWAWAAGMHLFSAIPDIEPDRRAGLHTTAVVLGRQDSLLLCLALWFVADQVALNLGLSATGVIGLAYPLLAIALVARPEASVFAVYRWMPLLNTLVGAVLFWELALR